MTKHSNYILIMAGGVGSRFWPASRESLPKQFLDITRTGKSLLRLTFDRASRIVPASNILIATNRGYLQLVREQLPELENHQILLEPSRNNTAPCIAYAALKLSKKDSDAVFAVMPADHIIEKENKFIQKIKNAYSFASVNDALVTLGIKPSRPDTGYGYIQQGTIVMNQHTVGERETIFQVLRFTEKPDLNTAKSFVTSGDYLWNAGIFIWSVSSVLNAFSKNEPQIINVLSESMEALGTAEEQEYINQIYPRTKSISVDYALMERSDNVFTIPADIGWSDLGTWNSLYNFLKKEREQNVIQASPSVIKDSHGNLIRSTDGKLVVVKGLNNFVIIDKNDVLLIYPREDEQEIKAVRNSIEDRYQ